MGLACRGTVVGLLALLAAGCGGYDSPTSPPASQNPGNTPPPDPTPSPGAFVTTGSLLSAIDDSAAAAIAFTVNGTLVGRSGAGGTFSVGFPEAALNRTVLSGDGFVARETGIAAPGSNLRLSLIPSTFDLPAFDQMFRHTHVSGLPGGLARWKTAPGLVLQRRVVQFTEVCRQSYQALDETISAADGDAIVNDMRDGYQLLTAGLIGPFASVSTETADPSAMIAPRQDRKIVVMRGTGLTSATGFWGYACWSTSGDGEVMSGFIILDNAFDTSTNSSLAQFHRSLRMHELGHTLGCQHVSISRPSVMNSNARTEPNEFDRQAARIAGLRPTGNRTPDIDPAAHAATTARGARTVIWHGAH